MCNPSAGKTGSCFPDEKTTSLQYVFRIPLPHMGTGLFTFLCAAIRMFGAAEFYRRRAFLCLCIPIPFPGPTGAMPPAS